MKRYQIWTHFTLFMLTISLSPGKNMDSANPWTGFESSVSGIVNLIDHPEIPSRSINLAEFSGHEPDRDGSYDFYTDIRNAIKTLAEQGGGTLHFSHTAPPHQWVKPTEVYRIRGPIHLESNIELLIDPAVKLQFECHPSAYLPEKEGTLRRYEGTTLYAISPLIYAFGKHNIRIRGNRGNGAMPEISGDGESWVQWSNQPPQLPDFSGKTPYWDSIRATNQQDTPLRERHFANPDLHRFRPTLFEFFMCEQVEIDGIMVTDPPFWVVHPVFSQFMYFHDMIFDCSNVNNDGFDPDSSRNILIEHIIFNNHDDNLAIKAGRDLEGRNGVDVTGTELEVMQSPFLQANRLGGSCENIVFRQNTLQGHYGIAVGSEMSGGVRNVFAYDCTAPISVKSLLFIKSSRKRGGSVNNIFVKNISANRVENDVIALIPNYDGDTGSAFPPAFSNIYVNDIHVGNARNTLRLFGWADSITHSVELSDITIDQFEKDPAYNFVKDIQLKNVLIGQQKWNRLLERNDPSFQPPAQN